MPNSLGTKKPKISFDTAEESDRSRRIMRGWCESNLYYLCTSILGMNLLRPHVHKLPCAFLDTRPYPGTTRDEILLEMPRDYFKSSILTIGATIQDILRNPSSTTLIVNEQEDNVKHFIRSIKQQFESNRKLQWLYPELIPDFAKTTWSDLAMKVRRPEGEYDRPEATIEGVGVAGTVVSRHYDTIVLDDLIGPNARASPSVMRRAKAWIELAEHLFISQTGRQLRCVGTPWMYDDVYSDFERRTGVRNFALPAEMPEEEHERMNTHTDHASGLHLKGQYKTRPTFPEEFPRQVLDSMYDNEGSFNYSCMMLLSPVNPDSVRFKLHWLSWYRFSREDGAIIPLKDGLPTQKQLARKQVYVASMVDPATHLKTGASGTAVVTWAQDSDGDRYLLDAWWKRGATPTEICEMVMSVVRRFAPSIFGWEDYSFFSTYRGLIRSMAAQAGVAIHFFPVKAGRVGDKPTRIGSLDGQFKSGHLHVREGLGDFIEEYRTFPTSGRMDLLDGSYYCLRPEKPLLRMPDTVGPTGHRYSPWHEKQLEQYEKSVDSTTGYGS